MATATAAARTAIFANFGGSKEAPKGAKGAATEAIEVSVRLQQEADTLTMSPHEEETTTPQRPGDAHPREQEQATATPKTSTRNPD